MGPSEKRVPKWAASAVPWVLGLGALFVLLAYQGHVPRASLVALVPLALIAFGVCALLPSAPVTGEVRSLFAGLGPLPKEPWFLAPRVTMPVAAAVLIVGALAFGYPGATWVTVAALLVLVPSALRRPGLFVFVAVSLLYLPRLGAYGLWDPWETHYGEVSREILARKDWISLWWAQENWFWSKPILIFWMEAATMSALGVNPLPDANPENAEWALRLPEYVLSVGAVLGAYSLVRRTFSVRAGVLSALVLATIPHFFFLAHQAITDMPFVGTMTIAMAFLGLAMQEEPQTEVAVYRVGRVHVSAQHLVVAALVVWVVPVALYLITRNVSLTEGWRFSFHPDRFLYGSAENAGVPGNDPHRDTEPFVRAWAFQPFAQGAYWLVGLAALVFVLRKERRRQALLMMGFYVFCALAFMAKGIPGFALPGLVALLFLIASRRWDWLLEGRFSVGRGILTVAVLGLPWYVAMYMRHGPRFTDRLLVHDHLNRLASGVHGDKGSVEYFLEQMGIGMFPWVGFLPAAVALAFWVPRQDGVSERQRHVLTLITLWFFAAFTLFSAMVTKFHHYIFPAEPAAALLVGITFDRALGREALRGVRAFEGALAAAAGACLVLAVGAAVGDLRGVVPEAIDAKLRGDWVVAQGPNWPVAAGAFAAGALGLFAAAVGVEGWFRRRRPESAAPGAREPRASYAVAFLLGVGLLAFVGRDLAWKSGERPAGFERLIHLFVYNYQRAWPDHFDYRPVLFGFAVVAVVLFAAFAVPQWRRVVAPAFLGVALLFTAWSVNVYLVDLSPHWGQRELIKKYYEVRKGPEEPLLAYQMNWKGENFYSGNRAYVFVKLDTKLLKDWAAKNAGKHAYAILEHSRVNSFKGHLRGGRVEELTTKRDNNKFVLLDLTLPKNPIRPKIEEKTEE